MPEIQSGSVHALYLFDVAQSIQLDALKAQLGADAAPSRIEDKTAGPLRVRYTQPPVTVDGRVLDCAELDGFSARVKFYDYGVISLLLSRPFAGSWGELVTLGPDADRERAARGACHAGLRADRRGRSVDLDRPAAGLPRARTIWFLR